VLAIPPFSPAWENFEDIMLWQQKTLAAMEDAALVDSLELAAYADEIAEVSSTLNDRGSLERSSSGTAPHQVLEPLSVEPKQTTGIKALWM
jgi:hypothetical protein